MWVTGKHPVEELLGSKTQHARKVLLSDAVPPETRGALERCLERHRPALVVTVDCGTNSAA